MLQTKTIISTLAALNDKLTCTLTMLYITFFNGKFQADRNGRVSRVWVTFRVLDIRGRGLLQAEETQPSSPRHLHQRHRTRHHVVKTLQNKKSLF